ncbi:unnamed protein product, partial [Musa acuminata var. zebrina]
ARQHAASAPRPRSQPAAASCKHIALLPCCLGHPARCLAALATRPHAQPASSIAASATRPHTRLPHCLVHSASPPSRPARLIVLLGRMTLATTPARSPRLRRAPWPHVPETDQCRQYTRVVPLGSINPEPRLHGQPARVELHGPIHLVHAPRSQPANTE